jgi:hypothetical protein
MSSSGSSTSRWGFSGGEEAILGGAEFDVETVEGDAEDPRQVDSEGHGTLPLAEEDPGDVADAGAEGLGKDGAGVFGIEAERGTSGLGAFALRMRSKSAQVGSHLNLGGYIISKFSPFCHIRKE